MKAESGEDKIDTGRADGPAGFTEPERTQPICPAMISPGLLQRHD